MEHWDTIRTERLALADVLDTLTPEQWGTQSLCAAWTVRDVAAHLTQVVTGSPADLLRATVRARGNVHRASELLVAEVAQQPVDRMVAAYRSRASSHVGPPGLRSKAPLTDLLVHRMDIAVPLGLELARPVEPWAPVLDFLTSRAARMGFVHQPLPAVRLVATDLTWSHGRGDQVSGPASHLALVVSGRPAGLTRLSGPGVPTLESWLLAGRS